MGTRTPVGTIMVVLSCRACGQRSAPTFVEGVIDEDGDLAIPSQEISWWMAAHYLPQAAVC